MIAALGQKALPIMHQLAVILMGLNHLWVFDLVLISRSRHPSNSFKISGHCRLGGCL